MSAGDDSSSSPRTSSLTVSLGFSEFSIFALSLTISFKAWVELREESIISLSPSSISLAMTTSPSLVRSATEPILLRYNLTGSVEADLSSALSSFESVSSIISVPSSFIPSSSSSVIWAFISILASFIFPIIASISF